MAGTNIKKRVAYAVLSKLSGEMLSVMMFHLRRSYGISIDVNDDLPLDLEHLHFGLSVLMGEDIASNILNEISRELREVVPISHVEA